MIKNNRNNEQIYGRNDMIMLDSNNKIYGSLGLADNYVMKTEEGTKLTLSNPKLGSFDDVLTEFNIYGMSKQESTTGANLIDIDNMLNECLVKNADDTYSILKTETNRFSKKFPINLKAGTAVRFDADVIEYNGTYSIKLQVNFGGQQVSTGGLIFLKNDVTEVTIYQDGNNDVGTYTKFKNAILSVGEAKVPYEPYTGGKPSPSPEYPQEIVSVGGNGSIEVNVRGKNLVDVYGYSASGMFNLEDERVLSNAYGTTLSTTEKTDKLIVNQEIIEGATADNYTSGYFCVGINPKLEDGKYYIISFKINVIQNPFHASDIIVMFNGIDAYMGNVVEDKVTVKVKYNESDERQYVEIRNRGMSLELSNFMITEVGETDDYEPYQEEQTVTLPYTLNAIPVSNGDNVTINGHQYIADYIDFKQGKFVKIINSLILDGDKLKFVVDSTNTYWNLPQQSAVKPIGYSILSNYFKKGVFFSNEYSNFIYTTQKNMVGLFETVDELNAFVVKKYRENDPVVLYYSMQEPIETELTLEQIEQYKKLSIRTPTTIVENNYNTWMKATYKSTESV